MLAVTLKIEFGSALTELGAVKIPPGVMEPASADQFAVVFAPELESKASNIWVPPVLTMTGDGRTLNPSSFWKAWTGEVPNPTTADPDKL